MCEAEGGGGRACEAYGGGGSVWKAEGGGGRVFRADASHNVPVLQACNFPVLNLSPFARGSTPHQASNADGNRLATTPP